MYGIVDIQQPVQPLPQAGQMRSANLSSFSPYIASLGGNPQGLLDKFGIQRDGLESQDLLVDCQPFVELFEYCAERFNQPLFGVSLAERQTVEVYGAVAAYCRSAPDVKHALKGLVNYLPTVHSYESQLELVECGGIAELRWCEKSPMGENSQSGLQGLMLNLKLLKELAGDAFKPSYINLPHVPYHRCVEPLRQHLGCSVRLSHDRACIGFATRWLTQPVASRNQTVYKVLGGYFASLQSLQQPNLVSDVTHFIKTNMEKGEASIECCAERLGVSSRTLQMRLAEQGRCFSSMLDQQRQTLAQLALKNGNISIAEVADSLGYAERTSFGRAFKRWTGVTPQMYRKQFI
ncbi:AraC family transcriptional regulator [Halioxenophilus aromaticivorans]|uniref:AraC family transcriptional regulator n=1 Tax=Halioxenophilus aromaticivorans TaxID=1306992 RepID=A0AAV3U9K0_9ALTE